MALLASENSDLIVAVGGDGTVNEVVNGLMLSNTTCPFTLFPLGTGNDFARNFKILADFTSFKTTLTSGKFLLLDIGEALFESGQEKKYFANILDVGMGAEVVKKMNASSRLLGPHLSYLWLISKTLLTYKAQTLTVQNDDGEESAKTMSYVIANGAWFGNDIRIAPGCFAY